MIDEKYPQTAEDFEKWLNKKYILWNVNPKGDIYYEHDTGGCLYLEDEMQASVYLKYFDKCGIYIEIAINPDYKLWRYWVLLNMLGEYEHKDRISALKVSIQKASEIMEKELTLKHNGKT